MEMLDKKTIFAVFENRIKEGWGAFAVSDKLVVSLMEPPAYRKYGKPYYRVSVHALIGFWGSYAPMVPGYS